MNRRAWVVAALAAVAFAYATALTGPFVWDDYDLIVENPLIAGPASVWDHFRQPFWSSPFVESHTFYRPLITLSYALDHRLWSTWAGGYHATNLLLHLGCTLLVILLCRRGGARWATASLLGAAFGLFPRLTESVAWVSGRTDPAATLFSLAALLFWPRRPLAAALALFLGLLSKETAIAAFVAMLVYDRRRWRRASLPGLAVLIYLALRYHALHGYAASFPPRTFARAAANTCEAIGRYAFMLLDPFQPRLQIGALDAPNVGFALAGVLVLILALTLLVRHRRDFSPHARMALALGVTALALVIHVVRLDLMVVAADRFLYLPVAALAIGCAGPLERALTQRRALVTGVAFLVLGAFAVSTSLQTRLWTDELALWRDAVAHAPPGGGGFAPVELAQVLMKRDRWPEALAVLDALPSPLRDAPAVRHNLAVVWDKLGRRDEAIRTVEQLVAANPQRKRLQVTLLLLYARALRFDDAQKLAATLSPDAPAPLRALLDSIAATAQAWRALPPESSDEPLATRATRARLFERLGAVDQAVPRWQKIALDPQVDRELRAHAAGYLALHADAATARATLDALAPFIDVATLRAIVDARFEG
jgi:tetratricopeptide (TPR) repeat protein